MKKQIVRISILQSSKMVVILQSLIGFFYAFLGALMLIAAKSGQDRMMAFLFLLAPIWATAIGFVFFLIAGNIYNLVARWIGGFEFEVEDVEDEGDERGGEINS